jgi:hypothetical protein
MEIAIWVLVVVVVFFGYFIYQGIREIGRMLIAIQGLLSSEGYHGDSYLFSIAGRIHTIQLEVEGIRNHLRDAD